MTPWGPFTPGIDPVERIAQLRALSALTACFCGSQHDLIWRLREAESHGDAIASAQARFDSLPALTKRRIIATFARLHRPAVAPRVAAHP